MIFNRGLFLVFSRPPGAVPERSVPKAWLKVSKETAPSSSWISISPFFALFFGSREAVSMWILMVFRLLPPHDEPDLAESENSPALKVVFVCFWLVKLI